jgi:hypothetical protein
MTPDNAVMTSAIVTISSTMAASILPDSLGGKGQLPPVRLMIGTGLTFFGLSILTDIEPSIGVPLAACIAFTAVTWYGIPVLEKVMQEK